MFYSCFLLCFHKFWVYFWKRSKGVYPGPSWMYNRSHWLLTYSKFTFTCIVYFILTYKFLSSVSYRKNICNVLVGKIKSLKICLLDFSCSFHVVWSQHLFKEYSLLIFDIGKQQWNHHQVREQTHSSVPKVGPCSFVIPLCSFSSRRRQLRGVLTSWRLVGSLWSWFLVTYTLWMSLRFFIISNVISACPRCAWPFHSRPWWGWSSVELCHSYWLFGHLCLSHLHLENRPRCKYTKVPDILLFINKQKIL